MNANFRDAWKKLQESSRQALYRAIQERSDEPKADMQSGADQPVSPHTFNVELCGIRRTRFSDTPVVVDTEAFGSCPRFDDMTWEQVHRMLPDSPLVRELEPDRVHAKLFDEYARSSKMTRPKFMAEVLARIGDDEQSTERMTDEAMYLYFESRGVR